MTIRVRTIFHHPFVALAAAFALVVQVVVPHVHLRHVPAAAPAPAVALASCDGCPIALQATAQHGDHDPDAHREHASCPLCRAQSDARASLLPPSQALPLPASSVTRGTRDAVAFVADAARGVASPRAPPLVS